VCRSELWWQLKAICTSEWQWCPQGAWKNVLAVQFSSLFRLNRFYGFHEKPPSVRVVCLEHRASGRIQQRSNGCKFVWGISLRQVDFMRFIRLSWRRWESASQEANGPAGACGPEIARIFQRKDAKSQSCRDDFGSVNFISLRLVLNSVLSVSGWLATRTRCPRSGCGGLSARAAHQWTVSKRWVGRGLPGRKRSRCSTAARTPVNVFSAAASPSRTTASKRSGAASARRLMMSWPF